MIFPLYSSVFLAVIAALYVTTHVMFFFFFCRFCQKCCIEFLKDCWLNIAMSVPWLIFKKCGMGDFGDMGISMMLIFNAIYLYIGIIQIYQYHTDILVSVRYGGFWGY